jgi:hypothetical protein
VTGRQELQNVNSMLKGSTENIAFLNRIAIKQNYKNVPIQLSAMSNLQMCSFGFKAIDYNAAVYVNPTQYVPRYIGANQGNGITNMSVTYGSVTVPQNGFILNASSALQNTELAELYQTYRMCCYKSGNSKDIIPAIPFKNYISCYCIFYMPFFDTIFLKETSDNRRVQLNVKADTTTYQRMADVNCTIVLHTLGSIQLFPDGTVSVLKSTY